MACYQFRAFLPVLLLGLLLVSELRISFFIINQKLGMLSLEVQEPLNVVYFDGSSASNSVRGHLDTQDLVIYGEVRRDKMMAEWERISLLCEWGKEFGIDAIVRYVLLALRLNHLIQY